MPKFTNETARAAGSKGGKQTASTRGREHMQAIGKRGWHELVAKRFGGDIVSAGFWLSRNGLRAQDPVPENGAWQQRNPAYQPRPDAAIDLDDLPY